MSVVFHGLAASLIYVYELMWIYVFLSDILGSKWPHQENNRQWHSVSGVGNCRNKCQVRGECTNFFFQLYTSLGPKLHTSLQIRAKELEIVNSIPSCALFVACSTTYITCPADPRKTLGIKLPFLVMIIKNLKKYFTFEVQVCTGSRAQNDVNQVHSPHCLLLSSLLVAVQINEIQTWNSACASIISVQVLDDKNVRRRFRASNYQSTTRVKPFICTMPMRLDDGWNQIQFNLSDFTRRAYGTNYIETLRVQVGIFKSPPNAVC